MHLTTYLAPKALVLPYLAHNGRPVEYEVLGFPVVAKTARGSYYRPSSATVFHRSKFHLVLAAIHLAHSSSRLSIGNAYRLEVSSRVLKWVSASTV